jgi:hypothetical protein
VPDFESREGSELRSPTNWEPADPPRRPLLFVNPRSGGGRAAQAGIAERALERGIEVIELGPDRGLTAMVDEAVAGGADAIGMAGGDGSLAIVAAAAEANELPVICVPAGTRNHFARDLGLNPGDPAGALDAFTDGIEGRIDVAEAVELEAPLEFSIRPLALRVRVPRRAGDRGAPQSARPADA